jgi:hypothetical protein
MFLAKVLRKIWYKEIRNYSFMILAFIAVNSYPEKGGGGSIFSEKVHSIKEMLAKTNTSLKEPFPSSAS